ncbi:carbohydrate ABC transporter permease [Paenibacillus piri]|uniref:Sugar ABC transporter permease n=1 Tax=Paenibacillus piri TaxID=2547395 RepID=A0A4V2ZSH6_9BACL|nr:sugar ABC transporter permease [Paenibacillus piri]TDF93264.1 sugar ABC transporter permease [Paenibacillus piri]
MNTLRKRIVQKIPVYVLILPCLLLLLMMMVYPIYQTIRFSMSEVVLPSFDTRFAGIDNFTKILAKDEVPAVFKNTIIWVIGTIVLRFILGFWAALTFNVKLPGSIALRIVCMLPWTVPSIVSANLWRWILQSDTGLLNGFLRASGLPGWAHNWLGDSKTAEFAVLLAYSWAGFPFVMLMLLAGMQGISKELYEAGKIDGANTIQLFRYITVPGLKSIMLVILLLEVISGFNSFDMIMAMTGGGPGGATEILGLFIYRIGFTSFDFGGASAISFMLLLIVSVFFVFYGIVNTKAARKRGMAG